jgi:hypothetical protein
MKRNALTNEEHYAIRGITDREQLFDIAEGEMCKLCTERFNCRHDCEEALDAWLDEEYADGK